MLPRLSLALFALGFTACAEEAKTPTSSAEYARQAELAYREALVEFLDENWEEAARLMEEVRRNYAYSPYAHKAHLRLADIAFRQEKFADAIAEYKAYTHDHPNDAEVPYARYRSLRAQFLSDSNNVFQPPLEERDLAHVRDAYAAIRAFIADYPDYSKREEIDFMFESVSGLLARHELYVARYYLAQERFDAATRRVQYALRNFADTGLEAEGIVLLGEISLKMKQPQQAAALFRYVLAKYPESAFIEPARRFLVFMGEPVTQPVARTKAP